jgi:hypothetical protein
MEEEEFYWKQNGWLSIYDSYPKSNVDLLGYDVKNCLTYICMWDGKSRVDGGGVEIKPIATQSPEEDYSIIFWMYLPKEPELIRN